jgi:fructose-1,6-bisphosphatase/inositol monophosphatase family enzyme
VDHRSHRRHEELRPPIPIWATLIALEEHGEITVGVIHNPVTGDLYTARRGGARS